MHKGDYHTDYTKCYDKDYKEKDLAFEHIKKMKQEIRKENEEVHRGQGHVVVKRKRIVTQKTD